MFTLAEILEARTLFSNPSPVWINAGGAAVTDTIGRGFSADADFIGGQVGTSPVYDVQSTKDSAGVFHFSIKSNTSDLTAVGLTTGTFYRGLMTERVNSRAEDYLNMDLRTADIIRFVAPGTGESYSLMVSSHIVIDQGNYVLYDQTWNEVCR